MGSPGPAPVERIILDEAIRAIGVKLIRQRRCRFSLEMLYN